MGDVGKKEETNLEEEGKLWRKGKILVFSFPLSILTDKAGYASGIKWYNLIWTSTDI